MESSEFFETVLKETPIFADLEREHILALADCAKNVSYPAKAKIYEEGQKADRFLIIREGNVAIDMETVHRGILTVHTVGPGEILGWSWLFPPHEWHYNARAVEDTQAIELNADCLEKKTDKDPTLGYAIMKRFSSIMLTRLEATRMQLLDIYDMSSPETGR